jgi:hypothetical protein
MDEQPDRYQSVKSTLLDLVKAGVGSAVLASSLLSTSGTDPAPGADPARIEERVRGVRDTYNAWVNGGWPNVGWRNLWFNGGWPNGGWGNLWRNLW